MASIHRKPKTKFFHAAWRDALGKLHLRSTKQTDRNLAMAVALEYERAEKRAGDGTLTEQQAREVLNDILSRAGNDEGIRSTSAADFFNEWIAGKEATASDSTGVRYQKVVQTFLASLGTWAKKPLTAITARHVEAFVSTRRNDGLSPGTIHLDVGVLRNAFNKARRMGMITTNPAEAVELERGAPVERGTFTAEEIRLMIGAARGEWRTLVMVGAYSGQRLGDCAAMKWADVDLTKGTWTLSQAKTKTKVVMPLHPDLLAHLEKLAGVDTAEEFVLPSLADKGTGGAQGLSELFKGIMREAGIDAGKIVRIDGKRSTSKRSFHALRHSFTSLLANADVSAEVRMRLTGHKSDKVHGKYTHHEMDVLKLAVGKLPGFSK